MSGLSSYGGITAKIRAKQRKMFHKEDYERLISCKSVQEILRILEESESYHKLFAGKDLNDLHRGTIELILKKNFYEDYISLYKFSGEEQKKFLRIYFRKLELSFLKACLRNLFNKEKAELKVTEEISRIFSKYSKLDVELLAGAATEEALVKALKGTEYYTGMKAVLQRGGNTLFEYEVSLDLSYFIRLWKIIETEFSGLDLEILTRSDGYRIDLLNLQWIYRCKKYYKVSPADIFALLIPINYKLSREEVLGLAEAGSLEEYDRLLKKTAYGKLYPEISGGNLEEIYSYLMDRVNDADSRKYPYSVAILNTYLYRKEHEIKKITTILECIRYGIDYDEILDYAGLKGGTVT
ncbi:MAG: V-type ATPase subunit [Lachnospiraceae bacterium]